MGGPSPKPSGIRLLEGNRSKGKIPINRREPKPQRLASLDPPAWLSEDAQKIWNQLAPEFDAIGVLKTTDVIKFSHYCEDVAESIVLRKRLKEQGYLVTGTNKLGVAYELTNGLIAVFNNLMSRLDRIGSQFGDSPSTRVRLDCGEDSKDEAGLMSYIQKKRAG